MSPRLSVTTASLRFIISKGKRTECNKAHQRCDHVSLQDYEAVEILIRSDVDKEKMMI